MNTLYVGNQVLYMPYIISHINGSFECKPFIHPVYVSVFCHGSSVLGADLSAEIGKHKVHSEYIDRGRTVEIATHGKKQDLIKK